MPLPAKRSAVSFFNYLKYLLVPVSRETIVSQEIEFCVGVKLLAWGWREERFLFATYFNILKAPRRASTELYPEKHSCENIANT